MKEQVGLQAEAGTSEPEVVGTAVAVVEIVAGVVAEIVVEVVAGTVVAEAVVGTVVVVVGKMGQQAVGTVAGRVF